jgi:hypothetical protein
MIGVWQDAPHAAEPSVTCLHIRLARSSVITTKLWMRALAETAGKQQTGILVISSLPVLLHDSMLHHCHAIVFASFMPCTEKRHAAIV